MGRQSYQESLQMHNRNIHNSTLCKHMHKHGFNCYVTPEGVAVEFEQYSRNGAIFVSTEIVTTFSEANKLINSLNPHTY